MRGRIGHWSNRISSFMVVLEKKRAKENEEEK